MPSVQLLKKLKTGIQMYNHKRKTPGAKGLLVSRIKIT